MWACPKCGESVEDDFEVCWSCGTNRAGQASPEFVPEQEGILTEPGYQAQQAARRREDLVTVATFPNAPEAHMARSRLEAEGIHAFVMDELAATTWGFATAMDEVPLQAAEKDLERARAVLEDVHHSPPPDAPDEDV